MSKGRYEHEGRHRRRTFGSKSLALVLACVLLVGSVVGGTVAWLTAKTKEVTNVFTASDIDMELTETEEDFKMVPGWTIDKDPIVTVKADSEDCWVFIKVEETGVSFKTDDETTPQVYSFNDFILYEIDGNNWTKLDTYEGVYYCKATDIAKDRSIKILGPGTYTFENVDYTWSNNEVLTRPEVTKEMMAVVNDDNKPTLSVTAYAVQLWKSNKPAAGASEAEISAAQFTPEQAWLKISPVAGN